MSQTILVRLAKDNHPQYTVVCGWDRPCNHFFGHVETENDEDEPFYSTMNESDADMFGGYPTIEQVKERIEKVVGILPEEYWQQAIICDMNKVRYVIDKQ